MRDDVVHSGNIDPNLMGALMTPGDGSAGLGSSAVDSPQDDGMGPPDGLGGQTPKRRRVTRACDECRRKKIKCDGKQVCSTFCKEIMLIIAVHALYSIFIQYEQIELRRLIV